MKTKIKKVILTSIFSTVIVGLGIVLAPEFITLNNLKPKLETAINSIPGLDAKINGDIKFGLIGGTKIVAHDISVSNGEIQYVEFNIPFKQLFNLESIDITSRATVYGADLKIEKLSSPLLHQVIDIQDSVFDFRGNKFYLINSELDNGILSGELRTLSNEFNYIYNFVFDGTNFNVKNERDKLSLTGRLLPDGSAMGALSIETIDLNNFFHFKYPEINTKIPLTAKFGWDGYNAIKFEDITGPGISGNISKFNNGRIDIEIIANDIDVDLSFLKNDLTNFYDVNINAELSGNIKFEDKNYNTAKINTIGTGDEFIINEIVADTTKISGGKLSRTTATELPINFILEDEPTFCLLTGTLEKWECSKFTHGEYTGSIFVDGDRYEIFVNSKNKMGENTGFYKRFLTLGEYGTLHFNFKDASGTIYLNNDTAHPKYEFAKNKEFSWLGGDFYFIPENMSNDIGLFSWKDDMIYYVSNSKKWSADINSKNGYFEIRGQNIKDFFSNMKLDAIEDLPYEFSGKIDDKNIYDLKIKIGTQEFTGNAIGKNINLETDVLNLDSLSSQSYIDKFESTQYLTPAKITLPFDLGINLGLNAKRIIYNGDVFSDFVYSLYNAEQTFSITDEDRGNLLVNIRADKFEYDIMLQLNNFKTYSKLFNSDMPLNLEDTVITGQAKLKTSGKIAFDFFKNLNGDIDLIFEGGNLIGLGTDKFYMTALDITTLNAEYMLSQAFESGTSQLKSLHLVGKYENEKFNTSRPFKLSLRNASATGDVITNDLGTEIKMNLTLPGISEKTEPVSIEILPNGKRNYSMSAVMINFDEFYLKKFVAEQNKSSTF